MDLIALAPCENSELYASMFAHLDSQSAILKVKLFSIKCLTVVLIAARLLGKVDCKLLTEKLVTRSFGQ